MAEASREAEQEYRVGCSAHGGLPRAWFERLVADVTVRVLAQDGGPALPSSSWEPCVRVLWDAAEAIGWPTPLPTGTECPAGETPGAVLEPHVLALAARVPDESQRARVLPVVRQLLKACVYPEFTTCRDSYRATTAEGRCARQQRGVAAARISGSPCVDCPYFVARTEDEHRALLLASWRGGTEESFHRDPSVFLPNDFRALRRFLWLRSRFGSA